MGPQFLPQDRVSEFARLKPEELLAATQKAIGDATLYDLHQELIEARKELRGAQQVRRADGGAIGRKLPSDNSRACQPPCRS